MKFNTDELYRILSGPGTAEALLVAYSGGLDSHVLLHALACLRNRLAVPVRAIHVNHAMNSRSREWARHCQRVCRELEIELITVEIEVSMPAGNSQEAWMRKQRYALLSEHLAANEVLLTAHHADDQAETLLLQLLRGSGPPGLAGMPVSRKLGAGRHFRPLLAFDRDSLFAYATAQDLSWVEDESNADQRFDRNYIRGSVMPVIARHWPSANRTLGRAAALQAEAASLLDQLATIDMENCYDRERGTLDIDNLNTMSQERQRNLLRHWLRKRGFSMPGSRLLGAVINEVIKARSDAEPCVSWNGVEVRRFRGKLYAISPPPRTSAMERRQWDLEGPFELPLGVLSTAVKIGDGLRLDACPHNGVSVGFRQGGESIRWPARDRHRDLKKLFQEHDIPPWLRSLIPLLFIDEELVSVAGVWNVPEVAAGPGEDSIRIHWTEADRVFGTR